jgi:hypothetical protein
MLDEISMAGQTPGELKGAVLKINTSPKNEQKAIRNVARHRLYALSYLSETLGYPNDMSNRRGLLPKSRSSFPSFGQPRELPALAVWHRFWRLRSWLG